MNLAQLEVLVAIVDSGSLTEAAEVVGLTQSAVSYSLSKLEAELGVILMERGRQGVVLTEIGKDVLQHARNILTQVEIIRQKTNREQGLSTGKVRFGVVPNLAAHLLTGILRSFQHKYPDIEVVLFEGNPHELLEWLETGVIDVGTVLIPDHYSYSVLFASAEIKVLLPQAHPLTKNETVPFELLANYPLIGPKSQLRMFNTLLKSQNLTLLRLRYEVSSHTTIYTMIREGMGISLMPEMLYENNIDGVVALSFAPAIQFKVYLATYVDSPATITFMNNAHQWSKTQGFISDET
jgi:DNA-binding transcriptional LysR family regulator